MPGQVEPDIVVIGSINHDLTVVTTRLPAPGETVLGSRHYAGGGGKGANQAVAAARLGARVAMVGRVGDDDHGSALRAALAAEGIDVEAVGLDESAPTGIAVITLDEHAENTIVVSPGANDWLAPEHLDPELIGGAAVVLVQLEIPLETVTAAAKLARGTLILNPAPARPLPRELLEHVDVAVPNRPELGILSGAPEPTTVAEAAELARRLGYGGTTVVTLGAAGAVFVDGKEVVHIPAPAVDPVDPTGAGDAFCGALGQALSQGWDMIDAVRRAVVAGALATTRPGAQTAMPTSEELEAFNG